jgi:glutathione S-transferase
MARLELLWLPGTCSRVTLVALEEIGEPFTTTLAPLDRAGDEEFMALNPKGKVPVLLIDGVPFTENTAIVTYLSRLYPQAQLLPAGDPVAETDALAMMSWFAAGVHPSITRLRFPLRFCDVPNSEERTRAIAAATLRDCFEVVEARLADRQWLCGEWSVVDAYFLWCWFRAVGSGMDATGLVRCAALAAACEERPSVARALDREEATLAQMLADPTMDAMPAVPNQAGRLKLAVS